MENQRKKRPIIVETGSDDPSTASPPIEDTIDPVMAEPVMDATAMGDATGTPAPETPQFTPTTPIEPGPSAGDQMLAAPDFNRDAWDPSATPLVAPQLATPAPAEPPVKIGNVTTTERTKLSDEAKEGQSEQLSASRKAEEIAGREGALGVANAKALSDLAAEEARQKEVMRRQEMEARAANQAKYQAGLAERDRILNDAEKQSQKDYWDDRSTGAHILAIFGRMQGEYAAAYTGHNGAAEFLDKEMARDDAKKQNILKQAIYRAGLKGQDAKEAYDNGLMEIGLRKAAVLDKLSDHRASVLASKGVDAATIAKDKLVNAAQEKSAQLKTAFGDTLNVRIHSSNELAQRYKMESALQSQKLAAASGKESGKGITDSRQRAQLALGIQDQVAVVNDLRQKGVKLTDKDLENFQDNQTYLSAVAHGEKNPVGAAETLLGRKLSLIPRNKFDGIDPKKAEMLGAMDLISQKAALLNAGAMTDESIRHARDQNDLTAPGIGNKEFNRRWRYVQTDLAGANAGMVPEMLAKARKGAEAAEAPAKMSSVDRARLTAWLDKNGKDPRAPSIRAALGR